MAIHLIQTCDEDPEWIEENVLETVDEAMEKIEGILVEDLSHLHGMAPPRQLDDNDRKLIDRVQYGLRVFGEYEENGYKYQLIAR